MRGKSSEKKTKILYDELVKQINEIKRPEDTIDQVDAMWWIIDGKRGYGKSYITKTIDDKDKKIAELENENKKLLERCKEEHQQICNAIDYMKRERACFIDNVTIQKLLYNVEYLLKGEIGEKNERI